MEYFLDHTPEEAVIPQIIISTIFFTVFYNGSKWISNLKSRTYREYFSPRERVDWNNRQVILLSQIRKFLLFYFYQIFLIPLPK
jgi:Trk-type K+ transport system membrane component